MNLSGYAILIVETKDGHTKILGKCKLQSIHPFVGYHNLLTCKNQQKTKELLLLMIAL